MILGAGQAVLKETSHIIRCPRSNRENINQCCGKSKTGPRRVLTFAEACAENIARTRDSQRASESAPWLGVTRRTCKSTFVGNPLSSNLADLFLRTFFDGAPETPWIRKPVQLNAMTPLVDSTSHVLPRYPEQNTLHKRTAEVRFSEFRKKRESQSRNEAHRWRDKSCARGLVLVAVLHRRILPRGKEGAKPGRIHTVFSSQPNRGRRRKRRNGGRKNRTGGRHGKP